MSVHDDLAAPFDIATLKFFPVVITKDGSSARAAAYIDARAVMDRLDAVVGPANWETSFTVIEAETRAVQCVLSIRFEDGAQVGYEVNRCDVGYPNEARDAGNADKEPLKAAYSDALKRAAVQFGIGRYLYSLELEKDWLPVDEHGRFLEQPRVKGVPGPVLAIVTPAADLERVPPHQAPVERAEPPLRERLYDGPTLDENADLVEPEDLPFDYDQEEPRTTLVLCRFCNGALWDNRAKKKSGEFKPASPDYGCRDKSCHAAAWIQEDGSLSWKKK